MGWRFEVKVWVFGDFHGFGNEEWYYEPVYQGNSLLKALWRAFRARREYTCVKLEMR